MKITLVAAIGLGVGLFAGSGVGAVRTKRDVLAALDTIAAATSEGHRPAGHGEASPEAVTLPPDDAGHAPDTAPDTALDTALDTAPDTAAPAPAHAGGSSDDRGEAAVVAQGLGGTVDSATAEAPAAAIPPRAAVAETDRTGDIGDRVPEAGEGTLSALDPDGAKKLAKIFSSMKAAAAAAVLIEMSDEEVTAILLRMTDRLAGPIVGAFPPDRAASLGRVVLRGQEGGS
jgi:hypothetical protein